MVMILTGFVTMIIIAPIITAFDPLWGTLTFATGMISAGVGIYAELYSK